MRPLSVIPSPAPMFAAEKLVCAAGGTVEVRFYNPKTGRYLSRDPAGYSDGSNVYIYVHANPINKIDALGLGGTMPGKKNTEDGLGDEGYGGGGRAPGGGSMGPIEAYFFFGWIVQGHSWDGPHSYGAAMVPKLREPVVEPPPARAAEPAPPAARAPVEEPAPPAARVAEEGTPATTPGSPAPEAPVTTEPLPEVTVSKSKYPESAKHIEEAQAAGQPTELTVDRAGAADRRKAAMKGKDKVPGKDRDEYPPAMFKEGGQGASVKAIDPSDNRGAGASMGHQAADYPNGSKVKLRVAE